MLMIYPLTLWSQNVLIENFWSEMNFPKRIIDSFQTSWNELAKLSIGKLMLTSQTLLYNSMTQGPMNYCLFFRNRLRYRTEISHVYSRDIQASESIKISISTRYLIWTQNLMAGHISLIVIRRSESNSSLTVSIFFVEIDEGRSCPGSSVTELSPR